MVEATARTCPLCNGKRGRRVWREDGYRYISCSVCHLVWADISLDEYAARRRNVWDEEMVTPETEDFYGRARERVHRQFLRSVAPRPGRLLDVGCGLGYFLCRARDSGWIVRGCDTSAAWVKMTNERIGDRVASVGELRDAIAADERFDVITAWDVIEHVHDPVSFLSDLASRLATGGQIFLRTPNLLYVMPLYALRRRLGHDVGLEPTNHVVYFTAGTMRRALARADLRPVGWPVLAPPQVETFAPRSAPPGRAVRLKNRYAAIAGHIAALSRGRAALGSDLDVVAQALDR
jgi:2-polyprenyl-3-methyl-5-hydroxy-6-metoxy-1,4-benzoquinol methylase